MRWKTRKFRLNNSQYEVLQTLMRNRPGVFKPLDDARLARAATLMVQGVHPWVKTTPHPSGNGSILYAVTANGRSKYLIEKQNRGG